MREIIKIRRGTYSQWFNVNPVLSSGELGLETDTLKLKAGDGYTAWNSLPYLTSGGGGGGGGSTWYDGAGVPGGGLGITGDYYLNTTNGDVYKKTGAWTVVGNIMGPTGPAGPPGGGGGGNSYFPGGWA